MRGPVIARGALHEIAMVPALSIRIYYSPRLDRTADVLELDSPRGLFQHKPSLVGPDELLARLIMGRIEAQNFPLGKERPDVQ